MRYQCIIRVIYFVILLNLFPYGRTVYADEPVVHALLFYSPSCPHCLKVITEDLPPIIDKYRDQILILGINTYTEEGNEFFHAAARHFNIPREHMGVPMMVVGDIILVGSYEIPQQFPNIIETGLVAGGIDWPGIPGLAQILKDEIIAKSNENNPNGDVVEETLNADKQENISNADINQDEFEEGRVNQKEQSLTVTSDIGNSVVTTENMTMFERFMQDKTGNTISTLVLLGMILSVIWVGVSMLRKNLMLSH